MNAPFIIDQRVDFRVAFLHRAHARLILFEAGEMDIAEAFDGLVANLQCDCSRELVARWERDFPPIKRRKTFR